MARSAIAAIVEARNTEGSNRVIAANTNTSASALAVRAGSRRRRKTGLASASTNDAGSYSVMVSNECGDVESQAATLAVGSMPSIAAQPLSQEICIGSATEFSVQAAGTEPLSYRWRRNDSQSRFRRSTPASSRGARPLFVLRQESVNCLKR